VNAADLFPDPRLIESAVALAQQLQERAVALQTPHERRQQAELERMLRTPSDKVTMMQMTDQAFRSKGAARTVDQFTHILDVQGIPRFFSPIDRALLRGFQTFGGWLPGVAVPLVKERMQSETANVVLPAETELLTAYLGERQAEGVRMNVNFLGEALLGEREARRRLDKYLEALHLPEIEVLSVKISTVYSQISPLAREHTVAVLCDRLERLYREAADLRFTRADGTIVPKFIYLDMEEYRDLALTAEVFMRTLERRGLEPVGAGIALQAYIPDSARTQRRINEWARARVAQGGSPVTIRIVKGANMEMERVEASLRGWPQAPFKTKAETDANYKRMLHEALLPENLAAVRVGVASHNLFDLAYGLVLAAAATAGDRVQFEMLEGMANHQRRALFEHSRNLLLYAPACRKEEFLNAIGYLIRRLDENTGPDNFLRHAFKLRVGSEEWQQLEAGFRESFAVGISDAPRRAQNRLGAGSDRPRQERPWTEFENEPDTDFSLPQNSEWAAEIVGQTSSLPDPLPVVVNGEERIAGRALRDCRDPSRPGSIVARCAQAGEADLREAVACARRDDDEWWRRGMEARSTVLGAVAQELRQARGRLIQAALAEGGKTIAESDPEVSEAVDFVEFYRSSTRFFFGLETVEAKAKGVVVVVSPWNFPIAIPCGGIAAALAAGNRVVLKPASDCALVAWELCQCFWRGGVSRRLLQFVPCSGAEAGRHLLTQPNLGAVILTGGTATALQMLRSNPALPLFAETGGKNATIVSALSDREQAVKNVIHSAFSHSGQKCSATSLLLLEGEVYDDPEFRRLLADAVESLHVGSAWELQTRVGPLIQPPSGELAQALTTLAPGESWAVQPRPVGDNPHLWSPGVKWGVQPGSVTHLTEFFGPVLGVMRFNSLAEAIDLVNATGYGLTSGLESLDDREQQQWQAGIRAGNLYINRPTTGAIVLRQPFGGMGKSCFGPGMKAGGPNYLAQFLNFSDRPAAVEDEPIASEPLADLRHRLRAVDVGAPPEDLARLLRALGSYDRAAREEFGRAHDHFRLRGEDNFRRYRPIADLRVRVHPDDSFFEICARAAAACAAGCRVTISTDPATAPPTVRILDELTDSWAAGIEFVEESDEELATAVQTGAIERVRFAGSGCVPPALRLVAHEAGVYLADSPVLAEGRIELLWYLREQSLSHSYHRYGNLGARSGERRAEPG
jgi:RHH-type proline utilization regulon transcriptional repressor/proline dehydrogenase/delta 1-pyrroline-5-carboxylate dehydrogenase